MIQNRLYFKISLTLLLLLCLVSCEKNAFFKAGETVSREILFEGKFKIIEVNSMLEITLVQDSINKAIVTCGENLQPNIDFYVQDSVLHLDNSIKYNWSRSYDKIKLELHLVRTPQLNIRKPVSIVTRDTFKTTEFFLIDWGTFTDLDVTLDVNNCAIDLSPEGFGHYTVKGKAFSATFNGKGSAFIYANDLKIQNCIVKQLSIGDIYVNVTNELKVSLLSSGNVYYSGNPNKVVVEKTISKGRLIQVTDK